jgi:hypothetical protein
VHTYPALALCLMGLVVVLEKKARPQPLQHHREGGEAGEHAEHPTMLGVTG